MVCKSVMIELGPLGWSECDNQLPAESAVPRPPTKPYSWAMLLLSGCTTPSSVQSAMIISHHACARRYHYVDPASREGYLISISLEL